MPNHVTTRCTVTGNQDEIQRFFSTTMTAQLDRYDDCLLFLDFNKIIPMPEALIGTQSGTQAEIGAVLLRILNSPTKTMMFIANQCYDDFKYFDIEHIRSRVDLPDTASIHEVAQRFLDENPEYRIEGEERLKAIEETGYSSWYPWRIKHWGTKWNSYHMNIEKKDPLGFTFDTAWGFPIPIFEKLADMFPELHFHCACYDEGGNFAGIGYFNPPSGESYFEICDATDDLYEIVYGEPPEREEDDDEQIQN